jgi:hypothetical protein
MTKLLHKDGISIRCLLILPVPFFRGKFLEKNKKNKCVALENVVGDLFFV